MPTYSYRCTECGNAFDIHQAFTDDALTTCEACGGRLRKLFNTIGVTFNGSGFYRTDSRSGGSGEGGGSTGSDASSGGSGAKSDASSGSSSGSKDSGASKGSASSSGSLSGSSSSGSASVA
ncbi:FmdB family transcriptional regulator [Agromyces intestinalis]|uniref:FmdB family transcriptional regulator n=1 Tax=Agromyces intestinalis TaxID=2592652 RepID=A0A5C1YHB5_9MICO|nr:FmdB family zinc ribbon protein [Agromyces intestinalis]QEO15343.1 FmdB family transcriptional regulator [Agromyces intestinalis]